MIHSFARDFAPCNVVGNALRTELTSQLGQPVALQEASLDSELGDVPKDERLSALAILSRPA